MAGPYTVTNITDVPLSSTSSLFAGLRGRTLQEDSLVEIFLNRETVAILYGITIGAEEVLSSGISALAATAGTAPSTRDDRVVRSFGRAGDEIIILAANSDAAAAREARAIMWVTPVDDAALQQAMKALQG